jgi:hypothetical protein
MRQSLVATDGKINSPACAHQFIGDLRPGGAGAYDQHGAVGELIRIAIGTRVHLEDVGVAG